MEHSSFRDLEAWKHARRLVNPVYEFTARFPQDEKYILVSQMRKAVHSVHSNIAEGRGRLSNGEWQQFLGQARGSLMELESDVIATFDLKYCTLDEAANVTQRIKRVAQLINGLLRASAKGFPAKKYKPST
jgi:four helix bundle protein